MSSTDLFLRAVLITILFSCALQVSLKHLLVNFHFNYFRIELLEWEHVTTLVNVSLRSEGTISGFKGYCAMGTNFSLGEEVQSRGRVSGKIFFDFD